MYHALLIFACTAALAAAAANPREGRRIINRLTSHATIKGVKYQLCENGGIMGACLPTAVCQEQGKFMGYCGNTETYCCKVVKTCGDKTMSHQATFKNPSYPNRDSDERVCTFRMDIGKKVCGVRLNFDYFELASYQSGVCITDTLTVLGSVSNNDTVTPICGNMTNWATNFPVEAGSQVTLAMVLQGRPPHKFSIRVTQLPCAQITVFNSPTYSGVRNADAVPYTPTTTPQPTESPEEEVTDTTTDMTTEESTTPFTTDPTTDDTPTTLQPDPSSSTEPAPSSSIEPAPPSSTEPAPPSSTEPAPSSSTEPAPTTLKPGKIPVPGIEKVVIRKEEEDGPIALSSVDSVPTTSAFRRAFELKVNDKCWQYEDESDTGFRIIGGSYTNLNEYPWQVALVYKGKFFCGGSLISDRHILTASHCVFGSFSKGIHRLLVSMGDHDLYTRDETKHKVGKIKSIHWNMHYNPHTTRNDIAILELQDPIDFEYGRSAVRLPTDLNELYETANGTVTGWGRFDPRKKKTSTVMKEFTGPLLKSWKCVKAWNKFAGINADVNQHICLDVTIGTPCHGDSGGPLVVCSGSHCTQVGVVSFGFPLCTNVGLPAVFARVTHFKSWIDMTTHSLPVLHV